MPEQAAPATAIKEVRAMSNIRRESKGEVTMAPTSVGARKLPNQYAQYDTYCSVTHIDFMTGASHMRSNTRHIGKPRHKAGLVRRILLNIPRLVRTLTGGLTLTIGHGVERQHKAAIGNAQAVRKERRRNLQL